MCGQEAGPSLNSTNFSGSNVSSGSAHFSFRTATNRFV